MQKLYMSWDKNICCHCNLLNPMHLLSTEANIHASPNHPVTCYCDLIIFWSSFLAS